MHIISLLLILPLAFAATLAEGGERIDITSCGQTIPARARGRLQADLVCSSSQTGVLMGDRSSLQLNDHSITGGSRGVSILSEARRVRIKGPGTISGAGLSGITASPDDPERFRMKVSDVVLTGNRSGIRCSGRVALRDVTVSGNTEWGIAVFGRIHVRNVTAIGNGISGIFSSVDVKGNHVIASGNGLLGINGNLDVKLRNLTAVNNGSFGVAAGRARLSKSTVTDNDAAGDGIDILSQAPPVVRKTVCGKSSDAFGGSWGVCTDD